METHHNSFDLDTFQKEVLQATTRIQKELSARRKREFIATAGMIMLLPLAPLIAPLSPLLSPLAEKAAEKRTNNEEIEKALRQAEEVVEREKNSLSVYLCPALKVFLDDALEIAKVITPILVPLVIQGSLQIPLSPMVFGALAVVIARMGVESLCVAKAKGTRS